VRQQEDSYGVSERRICIVLRFQRSSHRYQSTALDQAALKMRVKEFAAVRVRYGYNRIYILLRKRDHLYQPVFLF
jgi:putative transposase